MCSRGSLQGMNGAKKKKKLVALKNPYNQTQTTHLDHKELNTKKNVLQIAPNFYYGFYGVEEMDVLYWERKSFSYKKGKKYFLFIEEYNQNLIKRYYCKRFDDFSPRWGLCPKSPLVRGVLWYCFQG